jgi:hypothetical protein
MVQVIFTPSGPGHKFNALIMSGYVCADKPGIIDVTKEQAEHLVNVYPDNFSWPTTAKAVDEPTKNKAVKKPKRNKAKGGGG